MLNTGRLVVVTGPSHAGKTTTISAVRSVLRVPTAAIAIDDIIAKLELGAGDKWKDGLPAAYDVAVAAAGVLLQRGFVVFVESTFTFVPSDGGEPEIHPDQLENLLDLAAAAMAPCLVVRLDADLDVLHDRHSTTGRFDRAIVTGTWSLHRDQALGQTTVVIDTAAAVPEDVAAKIIDTLGRIETPAS